MNDVQDFDALRNNLKNLKLSLENERIKAQEKLFLDFTISGVGRGRVLRKVVFEVLAGSLRSFLVGVLSTHRLGFRS